MRSALLVLFGVAVSGCSSPVDPKLLDGTWREANAGYPGNYFQMTLNSQASTISGNGLACGEGGLCRDVTVVGNVDSQGIHLTITTLANLPTGGFVVSESRFDGHLFPGDLMLGKLRATGPGAEVGLVDDVRYMKGVVVPTLAAQGRAD